MMDEREFIVPAEDIGVDGAYFGYVEVIRCKDCLKKPICLNYRNNRRDYDFCSWAVRKSDG